MIDQDILDKYNLWINNAIEDSDLVNELNSIKNNEEKIEDAFYRDLEFGTGGLRGVIGAGTNRMNIYTVRKATQGIANYIIANYPQEKRKVAISYDSRIKSDLFSKTVAEVFAGNNIEAFIYKELMPTPCLSFATRQLNCAVGVMITASHNPAKYNGYKVYGEDGCQITTEAAKEILGYINKVNPFNDVKSIKFNEGLSNGFIKYIDDNVYDDFTKSVLNESVLYGDEVDKNVNIIYSPLNGTGLKPVTRALKEDGFNNVVVVKEQECPDGNFPTCPYPNPEINEAMSLGIEYAKKYSSDLLIATDPDCDRVGIAVRDQSDYKLLTGNEVGLLLLDFICSQRTKHNKMPNNPVLVKTIVTIDLAEKIAKKYHVETRNVLTGFKFIGEQIGKLEKQGKTSDYIFGFEESYGYLSGSYVRDKDAVDGVLLICEMFAYYKKRSVSLINKLEEIYKEFGYMVNTLHSYTFEGKNGLIKMKSFMDDVRNSTPALIDNKKVIKVLDYSKGIDNLPKSNVIKLILENDCSIVIRPSGTEPKLKAYVSTTANNKDEAAKINNNLSAYIENMIV